MRMILAQLRYDISSIESKLESIETTKIKMEKWIGKPIYQGCIDSIKKWEEEIEEHYKMIDIYNDKLRIYKLSLKQ